MTTEIIDKSIDIYQYPKVIHSHLGTITMGDMHGNALKLIHFLLQQGVVKIDSITPEEDYSEFVKLYEDFAGVIAFYDEKKSGIKYYQSLIDEKKDQEQTEKTKKWIEEWTEEINTLEEEFEQGQKVREPLNCLVETFNTFMQKLKIADPASIRLVGDEFADRGSCDYFTLKIFSFLKHNNIDITTLVSNHSNEFIEAYEHLLKGEEFNPLNSVKDNQKPSFLGLKYLLEENIVDREEVKKIVKENYKTTLKILDYTLSEEGIRIFTHAPVKFDIIQYLATTFKVTYDASTKEALAATIDKINIKFQIIVEKNEVHTFFAPKNTISADKMSDEEIRKWPLMYITWNRWNAEKEKSESDKRPAVLNGYNIHYVHGHDPYQGPHYVTNLDTNAGKIPRCGLIRLSENPEQILDCDLFRVSTLPDNLQTLSKNTMFLLGNEMYFYDPSRKDLKEPLQKISKDEQKEADYEKIILCHAKEGDSKAYRASEKELKIINSLIGRIPTEQLKHKIKNKPAYIMYNSIVYGAEINPFFRLIKFHEHNAQDFNEIFDTEFEKLTYATQDNIEKLPPMKDQAPPLTMHQYKIIDSNEKNLQPQKYTKEAIEKEFNDSQSLEPTVKRLIELCTNYESHLSKSPDKKNDKLKIIKSMIADILLNKSQGDNTKKIEKFTAFLDLNKKSLTDHVDNVGIQFLAAIAHILTFGIVSKLTKGTFKFWQSHGEALVENIEEIRNIQPKGI